MNTLLAGGQGRSRQDVADSAATCTGCAVVALALVLLGFFLVPGATRHLPGGPTCIQPAPVVRPINPPRGPSLSLSPTDEDR